MSKKETYEQKKEDQEEAVEQMAVDIEAATVCGPDDSKKEEKKEAPKGCGCSCGCR